MTSAYNNFNDFPEIVLARRIAIKIEKTFLVFSSVDVGLFLEWAQCYSISSTHLNPALAVVSGVVRPTGPTRRRPITAVVESFGGRA